jgi:ribonuclease P protein component
MLRWITAHNEYQEFFGSDRLLRSRHFFVPVLETSNNEIAIGITISKRIGKAVVRNLIKRRIKAFIRQHSDTLPSGKKINFIAKQGCGELSWQSLYDELNQILLQVSQCQAV